MEPSVTSSLESVQPNPAAQLMTVTQLIYGVPSFILMIFFLIYLGYSKMYTNSFYRIVQISLLVNILCFVNTWFALRLEEHPSCIFILKWIETSLPGALTLAKYHAYWFMHMQFCATAMLSLHRILTVVFAGKFERFCYRWYPAIGISMFVYSHLPKLLWPGFTLEVHIVNGTLMKTRFNLVYVNAININAIFSAIYFILILTIGIATVVLVTKKLRAANLPTDRISKKLTRLALIYCFLYTGILMWSVITSIDSNFPFLPAFIVNHNFTFLTYSSDIMTLSLPYILLAFDSNIQKQIFGFRKKKRVVTVVVNSAMLS
ncbi:Serpentine receptor class gamma [Caenorhabditis elegans]|uniref:Serpentine receptor class gamma n=1 Tax=Caenorhabditis elegans TaxID=6239 RepID=Q86B38_CAEEL|nr:Serpentine receptor class gamma [Caenorhabditis elegans]CCD65472.1 Serpentine receptor class gamma [Caenorhabditis elegans]|eukprot:NP_503739.2 Serpentine receptor class gamma [Caenorhabditis elegans]